MKKLSLVLLLLLAMPLAYAASPQYVLNVTTSSNGSVTLVDEFGRVGGPYLCIAGQQFEFRGNTKYDATVTDCQGQLSNLSCAVKEVSCGIPVEQINAIRNDIAGQPNKLIASLNETGLIRTSTDYERCTLDLNSTRVNLLGQLNTANQQISDLESRNTFYLVAVGVALGLFILVVIILFAQKSDFGDKLRGRDIGFRQVPKLPRENGGNGNSGGQQGLPPFPK